MTADQTGQSGQPALPFPPNMTPPASATQHGAPSASAPFVFSIGGQNVTDPVLVQSYINKHEQFAKDTREVGRKNFVAALKSANKITAPQEADMAAFACGLGDEQYEQWVKMWELAPTSSVLGLHGGTAATANPNNHAQASPEEQKVKDAEDVVRMHERGGVMTDAQIKATSAYQLLVTAGKRTA